MWNKRENYENVKPSRIEQTATCVLIRRNITFVEEHTEGEEIIVPAHYAWEELSISHDVWSVCKKILGYDEALDDIYAALTELAEIITEE